MSHLRRIAIGASVFAVSFGLVWCLQNGHPYSVYALVAIASVGASWMVGFMVEAILS